MRQQRLRASNSAAEKCFALRDGHCKRSRRAAIAGLVKQATVSATVVMSARVVALQMALDHRLMECPVPDPLRKSKPLCQRMPGAFINRPSHGLGGWTRRDSDCADLPDAFSVAHAVVKAERVIFKHRKHTLHHDRLHAVFDRCFRLDLNHAFRATRRAESACQRHRGQ